MYIFHALVFTRAWRAKEIEHITYCIFINELFVIYFNPIAIRGRGSRAIKKLHSESIEPICKLGLRRAIGLPWSAHKLHNVIIATTPPPL